jgi:hypothetical protein
MEKRKETPLQRMPAALQDICQVAEEETTA